MSDVLSVDERHAQSLLDRAQQIYAQVQASRTQELSILAEISAMLTVIGDVRTDDGRSVAKLYDPARRVLISALQYQP